MATGIETATLGLNIYKEFKGDILTKYKEFKFLFEKGLSEYIESYRKKYIKTNTFLFRNEKIDFYDTYFPLTLSNGKLTFEVDIDELFQDSSCIVLIGNAGSGKTMILRHLFLDCLEKLYTANTLADFNKVPIVIELRFLNKFSGSLEEYIKEIIFDNNLSPSSKHFSNNLKAGNFIFLLDGFDELSNEKREEITLNLDRFIDRYNKNLFLLTSRPGLDIETMPRFEAYNVNKLSKNEIRQFIEMQFEIIGEKGFVENIYKEIEKAENTDLDEYLSTPLLLSMFLLTFKLYPNLPKTKSKFYENVYDALTTRHDSLTKEWGYWRDRKTGLDNFEIKNILKLFSYKSYFDKEIGSFDKHYIYKIFDLIKKENQLYKFNNSDLLFDLSTSISLLIKDGDIYSFPHRSLQEYFTALLISEQNEDTVEKIYTEKVCANFPTRGFLDGYLFSLLKELDESNFIKYVILKFSKNYISEIDNINKNLLIDNIIGYYKVVYYKLSSTEKGLVGYSSNRNTLAHWRYIFKYLLVENFLDIPYFCKLLQILIDKKEKLDDSDENTRRKGMPSIILNMNSKLISTEGRILIYINDVNLNSLKKHVKLNKRRANELFKMYTEFKDKVEALTEELNNREKVNNTLLGV